MSFIILLVLNLDRVLDPPYWDGLFGVYDQGAWLFRHDLDYALLLRQPPFLAGGHLIDLYYAFAPLFALLLASLPLPGAFLVLHLLTLGGAALVIALFHRIIRSTNFGLLWLLVGASEPIWNAQTASVYLEMPLAAVSASSAYYLWKKRYPAASALCLAAYFIKSAALLQGLAYFLFAAVLRRGDRGARALLLPLPVMLILEHWVGTPMRSIDWLGLPRHVLEFLRFAPSYYPMLAVQLLALAAVLGHDLLARPRRRLLPEDAGERRWALFLLIFILGFWSSYVAYPASLVRYMTLIAFPLPCLLSLLLARHAKVSACLALALLSFNLLNRDGGLLKPLPLSVGRSGSLLERSREYLKDLDGNRAVCRELEARHFDSPIVAKAPFAQMLTAPEFGYVKRPLPRVIAAAAAPPNLGAADFAEVQPRLSGRKTLCVYSPNVFERFGPSLKPRDGDKIVFAENSLPSPVIVFERIWDFGAPVSSRARGR